jgi:murein DD-endopeptidase MepM/ murein hydrolase activator NlpD
MQSGRVRLRAAKLTAALLAAAVAAAALTAPAAADPRADKERAERQVKELGKQLAGSSARLEQAETRYALIQSQLPAARQALAAAEGELAAARALSAEMSRKLEAAEAAEDAAEQALAIANTAVADREDQMGEIARLAYQQGPAPTLGLVFSADSVTEYADGLAYLDQMMAAQNELVVALRAERAQASVAEARLAERRAAVAAQRRAAEEQVARTERAEQAARAAKEHVEELLAEQAAAVKAAQAERDEDLRQYRAMQAEARRLEQLVAEQIRKERAARAAAERAAAEEEQAGSERSSGTSTDSSTLIWPVHGPVTSPFGMRFHPILHYWKMHTGIDIGVPLGDPVHAAAGGTVIESYYNSAYGNRVVVSHGYINGHHLVTTYNHLSQRYASLGEHVDRGETIGLVGSTGWSTGPHLHFEVMVDGSYRDPMGWL